MKQLKLTLNQENFDKLHELAYRFNINYNTLITWLIQSFNDSNEYKETLELLARGIAKEGDF